MSTDKNELDDFHLTGNSPITNKQSSTNNSNKSNNQQNKPNQNTKNKENSKSSKSKSKPSPLNISTNNNNTPSPLLPRQRPKTPDGLSKNQAKKWRKNWDYEEKKRIQALKAQSKSSSNSSKKSSGKQSSKSSPSTKPQQNKSKQKRHTNVLPQYDNPHTKKKTKKAALVQRIPIDKNKQHSMFAHLPQNEKYLFYISPKVTSSIHPVILRAGLYYNDGTSWGANTRCITMLNAFRCVVNDFKCPSNKSFGRELLTHLNPCIQFLNDCRPQSVSMGNTIRWLKSKISQIASEQKEEHKKEDNFDDDSDDSDDLDTSDDEQVRIQRIASEYNEDEQKNKIIQAITDYVFKIETADKMIQVELIDRIKV